VVAGGGILPDVEIYGNILKVKGPVNDRISVAAGSKRSSQK